MGRGGAPLTRALFAGLAVSAGAGRAQAPGKVGVEAIPEVAAVAPGAAFRVALRLRVPRGCHISWINPGQSGLPTTITWRTPAGVHAGATEWPYPERDEAAGVVNHVYHGLVVAVTRFEADSSASGVAVLRAALSYGVCGANCIRQRDTVEVSLPIGRSPAEPIAAWRSLAPSLDALPLPATDLSVAVAFRGDRVRLTIAGPRLATASGTVVFFPLPRGAAVVARARRTRSGVTVTLPVGALRAQPGRLSGVLVAERPWLAGSRRRALAIQVPLSETS